MNNLITDFILLFLRAERAIENLKNKIFLPVFPQTVGLLRIYFQHHEYLHSSNDSYEESLMTTNSIIAKNAFDLGVKFKHI